MEIFFYTWNIFLGDKNGYHKIQVLKKQNKTNPKKPKPNKKPPKSEKLLPVA